MGDNWASKLPRPPIRLLKLLKKTPSSVRRLNDRKYPMFSEPPRTEALKSVTFPARSVAGGRNKGSSRRSNVPSPTSVMSPAGMPEFSTASPLASLPHHFNESAARLPAATAQPGYWVALVFWFAGVPRCGRAAVPVHRQNVSYDPSSLVHSF